MPNTKELQKIIAKLDEVKNLTDVNRLISTCNEVISEIHQVIDDKKLAESISSKLNPSKIASRWEEFNRTGDRYDLPDVQDAGEALQGNIKEVIALLKKQL